MHLDFERRLICGGFSLTPALSQRKRARVRENPPLSVDVLIFECASVRDGIVIAPEEFRFSCG
jgi:hypothetical protein